MNINLKLTVFPEQRDLYQFLLNRVMNNKILGLHEWIQENWAHIASLRIIELEGFELYKFTYNHIFWLNMTEIWEVMKSQEGKIDVVSFASEIEKVSKYPENIAKQLQWNLISAVSLKFVDHAEAAKSKAKDAALILVNAVNLDLDEVLWMDVVSDTILMIAQLYQWEEVDLYSYFVSSVLENIETSPNSERAFYLIWSIGSTLLNFGDPLTINCFELCARISRNSQNYEMLVAALTNMGAAVNDIGKDPQKGLEISLEAIATAEMYGLLNDTHAIFDVGNIMLILGRGAEAEPYLRRAVTLGKQRNEYSEVVNALRALARQFYWRGLAPDAKELYEEAIAIGVREHELRSAQNALAEYGDLLRETGEYENAKEAFLGAKTLAEKVGDLHSVKDYLQSAETMDRAINGEVVFFQAVEDGKWQLKSIPRTGFEELIEKDSDSLIPYWSLYWTADTHEKFEQEKSEIAKKIVGAVQNHNTHLEAEYRISLTWLIFEYLVIRRFYYDSEDALRLIKENNKSLLALEGIQDQIVRAGSLLSLAIESIFPRFLENRIEESQHIHSALHLELGTEYATSKNGNAVHPEDISLILDALNLYFDSPGNEIDTNLDALVILLPTPDAFNILKSCLSAQKTRKWALGIAHSLQSTIPPDQILPIFKSFETDTSLNPSELANLLESIGSLKIQLGLIEEGQDYLQKALALCTDAGDKKMQAVVFDRLGIAYRQIGKYKEALQAYDWGIQSARSIGLKDRLARLFHHKGNLLFDTMNFPEARNCFYLALDEYLKVPDYANMAFIFDNLANIATAGENQQKQIWYRRRALDLATWSNDLEAVALCSYHLGSTYSTMHEFEKSFKLYTRSSELYSILGRKDCVVFLDNALGQWYVDPSNPNHSEPQAIKYFERSLSAAQELGVTSEQISSLSGLAQLYVRKDFERSIAYLNSAIDLCYKATNHRELINLLKRKAQYHLFQKKWADALNSTTKAVEILENIQSLYSTRIDYQSFIANELAECCEAGALYAFLSEQYELAFYLTERAKSTSMRDQLAQRWKSEISSGMPQEWLKRETELLSDLRLLRDSGQFVTGDNALKRDQQYREVVGELQELLQEFEKISPNYIWTRKGVALDAQKVEELLANWPGNPYLIEFLFIPQWKSLLMMVIHPGSEYTVIPIIISKETLEQIRHLITIEITEYALRGNIGETWHAQLSELAEAIIEVVPEGMPIIFVPHSDMHHLPLHALPVNGRRLIERNPISYLPSASILQFSQGKPEIKSSLVVGSVFEEEAYKIADLLSAQSLIGKDAKEFRVRGSLSSPNIIHFSCHGIFDSKYPLMSGLALSGEDVLTADAILQTQLNASLVVLSACQTGQSKVLQGDELQGLTQAFMIAGAQTVISTLWSVEEKATTEFMTFYYRKILNDGENHINALRQTQVEMIQNGKRSHPFYWAAFAANSI